MNANSGFMLLKSARRNESERNNFAFWDANNVFFVSTWHLVCCRVHPVKYS